jgi:hypothetical protein
VTNRCPFCANYAYAVSVGDAYQLDCRYCDIQVEITKRAYSARCPDPVGVLDFIRERMKTSTRPRVDLPDMKRVRQPPALTSEEQMTNKTQADSDVLTTAAKAIGTTLGKIAVKTGMAKPPAVLTKFRKKAAPKTTTPAPVARKKTAPKAAPKRSTPLAKSKPPTPKHKTAK